MSSIAVQPLAAATALPALHSAEPPRLTYLPRPMTHDPHAIARGRMKALARYSAARSDSERLDALLWVNHWRGLNNHAAALRTIRLID